MPGLQQHHRRRGAKQQTLLDRGDAGVTANDHQIPGHEGEGFAIAALALAQGGDGLGVGRIAGEMKAADALDGQNSALAQEPAGGGDDVHRVQGRGGDRLAPGILQPSPGPADRTGDGLGMEAPVRRVFVFPTAVRAEGKCRHAGIGPVVRDSANDAQTRTAMSAVAEGITKATVGRVRDLGGTGGASGGIRHHAGVDPPAVAGQDLKG